MADNLTLEILKQIQSDQGQLRNAIKELKDDIRSLTRSSFNIEQDMILLRSDNLNIKDRLERIERRLELNEEHQLP